MPTSSRYRFVFISSNPIAWGGSEELWAAAAVALAEDGHRVYALKGNLDTKQRSIRRLRELKCRVADFARIPFLPRACHWLLSLLSYPLTLLNRVIQLGFRLAFCRSDLIVLSQGGNCDGLLLANVCRFLEKPYVIVSQKAGDIYWPLDMRRDRMRAVYEEAEWCYFVSEHNRRLTEEQIGARLRKASVVRNPFLVPWERRDDWPSQEQGIRLACVGRLYVAEKGQDMLIRVLARPKWRNRPLSVTFFGSGEQRVGLERMAEFYGVTNVAFAGFVDDVAAIWNDHHGLILPTRCEGLPLVVVEAMLSGRVVIATDVAGNREVVANGRTGFLAATPTEDAIDEALERAWQRRGEWQAIGAAATDEIRNLVPQDPGREFAALLERVAENAVSGREDEGETLLPNAEGPPSFALSWKTRDTAASEPSAEA